jgi:uncharacterized Tic20 family protein
MADALPAAAAPTASPDDRTMALLLHILGIFTGFLGPLIVWLVKKDSSPFLDQTGRKALNFHFSTLLYAIVCFALMLTLILIPVAFLGFAALAILRLVFGVLGCIRASEGQVYAYPLSIKFL